MPRDRVTPSEERFLALLLPRKKYRTRDVAQLAGVATDHAARVLRLLAKAEHVIVSAGPGNAKYKLYQAAPKVAAASTRRDCREARGDVWLKTWPHADTVVIDAMKAMIREGART
ncbi:MAG TPA: hypothetical protein VN815_10915 [Steroidobacteraceae bacterium]|nr:hypothetical protein [Steroidobacteraceae bacterium]